MPRSTDNYVPPKYGDNTKPGGVRVDLKRADPKMVDDFSAKWKEREEEKRKQNQSSGQGSSKN
jgi:hypothetical protein